MDDSAFEKPCDDHSNTGEVKRRMSMDMCNQDACVNCELKFRSTSDKTTKIGVVFGGKARTLCSIVETVCTTLTGDADATAEVDLNQVGLCLNCAKPASKIFQHYIELRARSTPTSPLSRCIPTLEKWQKLLRPFRPDEEDKEAQEECGNMAACQGSSQLKTEVEDSVLDFEEGAKGEEECGNDARATQPESSSGEPQTTSATSKGRRSTYNSRCSVFPTNVNFYR